jgi:hypothetical protein
MGRGIVRAFNLVHAGCNDLAVLDDHRAERPPARFKIGSRKFDRIAKKTLRIGHFSIPP